MTGSGRKLKNGSRTPSGQLSREGRIATRSVAPAEIMRLRDQALAGVVDPLWGSNLGKMHLEGELTAHELEAGKRWENLSSFYAKAMGMRELKAMNIGSGGKGASPDPDSETGHKIAEREAQIVDDYIGAEADILALGTGGFSTKFHKGRRVLAALDVLCIRNMPLSWEGKRHAKDGLAVLCERWGLTKRRV